MSLTRMMKLLRWAVPLVLGAAVLWIGARSGPGGAPLVLAVLGGAVLGAAVALALEAVLCIAGLMSSSPRLSGQRLQRLERDKLMLLRAIKEIDLDAALQRLPAEEAAALSAPLRVRAMRLLRELDEARQEAPLTVKEQIERELSRRLAPAGTKGGAS